MEIQIDIDKRIEWIKKRTHLSAVTEQLVRFQMQDLAIEVIKKL